MGEKRKSLIKSLWNIIKASLITILAVIWITLILLTYGSCNLKSNSVYYAKNTPHKDGVEPVLMMLADNLFWIYTPDIKGIEYDFNGNGAIRIYDNNKKQIGFFTPTYKYGKTGYLFDDEKEKIMIEFDSKFQTIEIYDIQDAPQKTCVNKTIGKEYKRKISNILQPVIDKQTEPLVNLQWIFDIVYIDRFN